MGSKSYLTWKKTKKTKGTKMIKVIKEKGLGEELTKLTEVTKGVLLVG